MTETTPTHRINALFLCSRNQWRSPTAEQIWRDSESVNVRARGLSPKAVRAVTEDDITWADIIFVMGRNHRGRLVGRFPGPPSPKRSRALFFFGGAPFFGDATCEGSAR